MSFRDSSTAAAAPGDPVSRGPTEQMRVRIRWALSPESPASRILSTVLL